MKRKEGRGEKGAKRGMKDKKARKPSLPLFLGIQKEMKGFNSQENNKKSSIEYQKKKKKKETGTTHIF